MKTVILTAGKGVRLRPITKTIPKSLIKIGEETLLERSLNNIVKYGIKEAIVVIGHLGEKIQEKRETSCRL